MTDIKKLAGKHARGFDDPKVKHAIVHALQELQKQIMNAIEPYTPEQEYGWEWASNPYSGPHIIHGSDSKESAERAMQETVKVVAPVRIMVRNKAVPGEWREA